MIVTNNVLSICGSSNNIRKLLEITANWCYVEVLSPQINENRKDELQFKRCKRKTLDASKQAGLCGSIHVGSANTKPRTQLPVCDTWATLGNTQPNFKK